MSAEKALKALRQAVRQRDRFPFGMLLYFGPDDCTVTRIIAGVMPAAQAAPIAHAWNGDQVASDPVVIAEIGHFFQQHQVSEVIMPDCILGCPHEPGVDYPVGENCPHCPFWANQ